jgi:Fur family zinc uptake transcriptional regulator
VKKKHPNVSYDTIYRTLSLLLEKEIIEKMEFNDEASKYRLVCDHDDEGHHHHHHLVCVGCGSISTVTECPMEFLQEKLDNFTVTNHRFEIQGYCSSCADASK